MSGPRSYFRRRPPGRETGWLAAGALVAFTAMVFVAGEDAPADAVPEEAGLPAEEVVATLFTPTILSVALDPVEEQIERGAFPGAALAFGVRDQELHLVGRGSIGWTRNAAAVDPEETIYDLASLTKVMATAAAVLLLVDEGKMSLDDPVSRFLPAFSGGAKDRVTVRHLLTHTSGLPGGANLRGTTRRDNVNRAVAARVSLPPGTHAEYSDIGYIVLWEAAERAAKEPLPRYLERRLYAPLGMTRTGFLPGLDCEACAPTGRLRDQRLYRGKPFDPTAQRLDGISGNAGLFSTAADIGRFAAMITSGGVLDGVRVLREETVREFLSPQPVAGEFRLGWEVFCLEPPRTARERCPDPIAVGHTGWTGTSLWIDPARGVWVVLLTNRTYEPRASNQIGQVRRELFLRAAGLVPIDPLLAESPLPGTADGPAQTRTPPPGGHVAAGVEDE
jgi:serine-type D-Ala-D-Ala carboxypeptidase